MIDHVTCAKLQGVRPPNPYSVYINLKHMCMRPLKPETCKENTAGLSLLNGRCVCCQIVVKFNALAQTNTLRLNRARLGMFWITLNTLHG